ncbi:ANTAR domain-containing protein [Streptomyces gilvus]|uniref:ANTAR domain-containing protein n=1 Tax=Streptomyces gilvus TaxID=2920937 RepID=UPI001F10F0DE|nr:ANTAR domain-containing protein [Streptomyces sp. CME 23]MCH5677420.1 ANTAR domain-containing protein [Streptomyces sp. CME 23]
MPEPAHAAQPRTSQDTDDAVVGGGPSSVSPCLAGIHVLPVGERTAIRIDGELDFGSRQLRDGLEEALDGSASGVDLDLGEVGFCDCAGLNLLLDLRRRAMDHGKTVTLRVSCPSVDRLLELTGAWELFPQAAPASKSAGAAPDERVPRVDVDGELRREVAELRRAMRTRPGIDLARGILMATFNLTPEAAWTVLVTTSQNTNTKLHVLAQDLVGAVQGKPLPEEIQQQVAAAVTQARRVMEAPPA